MAILPEEQVYSWFSNRVITGGDPMERARMGVMKIEKIDLYFDLLR
jgi:hypothetical protein